MSAGDHDQLRASLRDLADITEPTDMYDRAVHRSRGIGRREAAVGTTAAVVVLAALGSGLWHLPRGSDDDGSSSTAAVAPSQSATVSPSWSATMEAPRPVPSMATSARADEVRPPHRGSRPQTSATTATPLSRTITDLPGHAFYREGGTVVKLSPADGETETVLRDTTSAVGVSPDGARVAYEENGALMVGPATSGGTPQQVATGVTSPDQAPAWSPTGDRLLVAVDAPGVLDLASGEITPLPEGLTEGQHFRWSGDGSKLVYATSYCGLGIAGTQDQSVTAVPVLGDTQTADNPDGLAACKPTSVDATGERVTVPLQTTGEDAAGTDAADAIVDTATGDLVRLPVSGTIVGAVFDAGGNLLVRTRDDDVTRLSLFGADNTLKVQATEPASVRDLDLFAYTR
ncbi:TolB family protein [Actinoplanes sp. NPDC000266]